ncbi:MAG: hypothetical protein KBE37_12690 [Bacteroidia bacterium]|nr:hypothetical protein [Bacteroidia bacterium]
MAIINPSDLTFSPVEIKDIGEAIFVEVQALPMMNEFLTPYEGIKSGKQIVFMGVIDGLVGQSHDNTNCAPVENTAGITNTEKFWDPAFWDDRFSECWDDLIETVFVYSLKEGVDRGDLTSTDFGDFFVDRYKTALAEMFFRFVWFGDTDAATISASPAGHFVVSGFAAKRWNLIDGIWKQIFAAVAANSARLTAGLATKNAEATFADQAFDSTDTTNRVVTTMLQNLVFNADMRLRAKTDKVILVTQTVADQYVRELEASAANGIPVAFDMIQEGISVIKRMGVTIYAISFWDNLITTYMRNAAGTGYYLPHRAILTIKSNLAYGTSDSGNFSKVKPFADNVTNKTYFDIAGNLDAKLMQSYLFQAAY